MSVASLHIAGAHPRPVARVCGHHSPWPMSVTCRARVGVSQDPTNTPGPDCRKEFNPKDDLINLVNGCRNGIKSRIRNGYNFNPALEVV